MGKKGTGGGGVWRTLTIEGKVKVFDTAISAEDFTEMIFIHVASESFDDNLIPVNLILRQGRWKGLRLPWCSLVRVTCSDCANSSSLCSCAGFGFGFGFARSFYCLLWSHSHCHCACLSLELENWNVTCVRWNAVEEEGFGTATPEDLLHTQTQTPSHVGDLSQATWKSSCNWTKPLRCFWRSLE